MGPPALPLALLGRPWDPIRTLLGRLWFPFSHLGTPLGFMWSAWGPRRPFGSPIARQARFGDLVNAFVRSLSTKTAILELVIAPTGATGAAEVVSKTVAQTPPSTRAGGQDDGSYTNPSNKCRTCCQTYTTCAKRNVIDQGRCPGTSLWGYVPIGNDRPIAAKTSCELIFHGWYRGVV